MNAGCIRNLSIRIRQQKEAVVGEKIAFEHEDSNNLKGIDYALEDNLKGYLWAPEREKLVHFILG